MLELQNVSAYDQVPALRDISFSVEAGKLWPLLAQTGLENRRRLRPLKGLSKRIPGEQYLEAVK